MTRWPLAALRTVILEELLGDEWITANEIRRALGSGGHDHYRIALVLDRLTLEGVAEIRNPRSRGKRFYRRRRSEASS